MLPVHVVRLVALGALWLVASQADAVEPRYIYQWFLSEEDTYEIKPPIADRGGELVVGGDAHFHGAYFCSPDDEFICVIGWTFAFAVPRVLGTQDRWQYRDQTWEVTKRDVAITIFGTRVAGLMQVTTHERDEDGARDFVFLYSPASGLLAFSWHPGGTYWLRGTTGFGSHRGE